jgi:hypothetical protein
LTLARIDFCRKDKGRSRPPLAVEMRHRLGGVAIALGGAFGDRLFDCGKVS